jgi:hypothetical protein
MVYNILYVLSVYSLMVFAIFLRTQLIFADFILPQIRKCIIFILTNICLKCSNSNLKTTFSFWDSFELHHYMALRSLKYSYVGKENITVDTNQCGSGSETLFFSMQICGFAICGQGQQGNVQICDLRSNHYKFTDLRFADWHTSEICGLAIAE